MNRIYVALDLETTGLDPERDAIMEIGAVRFRTSLEYGTIQAKVLDTWSTLVNPGRPSPIQIPQLTGIRQEEVDHAPRFSQILSDLRRFVGSYAVVGHNIYFDLRFLHSHGLAMSNLALDTFELAGILAPHSDRYSLTRLGQDFGLSDRCRHRALDDALAAQDLFVALMGHAAELPPAILQEIGRLADKVDWSLKEVFRYVERGQARTAFSGAIGQQLAAQLRTAEDALGPLFAAEGEDEDELVPAARPRAIEADSLAAMLEQNGLLARHFPGFEHRPQQVEMLRAVAMALNEEQHLLVEAGTGTGKSLAYLLPAIVFAHQNNERVVVSTNTINLQDQLFLKDTPDLQRILPFEFRAAVLKGRSNYLCQRRLAALRQTGINSTEEMRMLAKVLVWVPSTQTGERGELFMPDPPEQALWSKISADSETCTAERCRHRERGRCFFYRARRAAERAHLVIVNHALLLSDVAVDRWGGRVLPDYRYLIVDEAHHLENSVTRQLSFEGDQRTLERTLNELARPVGVRRYTGFLADLLARCRGALPPEPWATLDGHVSQIQRHVEAAVTNVYAFFHVLGSFLQEHSSSRSEYDQRLRLTSGLRVQPAWSEVEVAWENLNLQLHRIVEQLEQLCRGLEELEGYDVPDLEGLTQDCAGYLAQLRDGRDQINACIAEPSSAQIYWATISSRDERVTLHAAPLHVGDLVQEHLFHNKRSVILTSATLTTDGQFDFVRERLNAWEADELTVGSPFDYKSSTLLYLPTDIPEPNQPHSQKMVDEALVELCRAAQGRTLVLFTSYHQLRTSARAISRVLGNEGISVLEQGSGTSRAQLLESFRNTEKSVLMGTRSFWEGIDVVGPALSVLVLARLPFSVPDDPIFAARAETFDDPFGEFAIPETILRFRQGFGRLIRTKTDRGVVVILDKRVLTKSYGPMFLNSLPECTRVRAPLERLGEATRRWLANDWPRTQNEP
ncbi:MAG TPA: helicase C-terminal domain-containing protein [Anaerolineae bacterium]|nr:helicase C-terminal domain-containing protein [Anaerolineae bacterium]